jgi:sugar phosphate isomerase/epimerase
LGEYQQARAHFKESLLIARKLGFREVVVEVLYGLAALAAAVGGDAWAGALIGAAQREGDFGHVLEDRDRAQYERTMSTIRQNLGPDRLERAIAAGRAMTLDSALRYLQAGSSIEDAPGA